MYDPSPEFVYRIKSGLVAARKRIDREETYAKISDEACDRSLNILSYAFEVPEVWEETRELLFVMAPKMEMAGHRGDWIPFVEKAAVVSEFVGDAIGHSELCLAVGYLELLRADYEKAETWFRKSIECFRAVKSVSGQGRALNRLALVQLRRSNYQDCTDLATKALEFLDDSHIDRANSFFVLATVRFESDNWAKAETYYRKSLKIWEKADDKRRIAWGLRNLGPTLFKQGRNYEAEACYKEALNIFELVYDPQNEAIVRMNLGILYWSQEELARAKDEFLRARKTFRLSSDRLNLAKVNLNLGLNLTALGQWSEACEACTESIGLWKQLGNIPSLCNAIDALGEVYLATEEYSKAIEQFQCGLTWLAYIKSHPRYESFHKMLRDHLCQAEQRQ